jgi:hypothetical protein
MGILLANASQLRTLRADARSQLSVQRHMNIRVRRKQGRKGSRIATK